MLPDRVSNPGPLTYESGALPIALRYRGLRGVEHIRYDEFQTKSQYKGGPHCWWSITGT